MHTHAGALASTLMRVPLQAVGNTVAAPQYVAPTHLQAGYSAQQQQQYQKQQQLAAIQKDERDKTTRLAAEKITAEKNDNDVGQAEQVVTFANYEPKNPQYAPFLGGTVL